MNSLQVSAIAKVDIGLRRPSNEDAVIAYQPPTSELIKSHGILIGVADGVGSSAQGKEASQHGLDQCVQLYYSQSDGLPLRVRLLKALEQTNQYIRTKYPNGASTLTIGVILNDKLHIVHIGDSRGYLIRGQDCRQITEDHVKLIPNSKKTLLARAMGQRDVVVGEYYQETLQPNDFIILLTDGATRYLDTSDLVRICNFTVDKQKIVDSIIAESKSGGGIDNIGVALAKIHHPNANITTIIEPGLDTVDVESSKAPIETIDNPDLESESKKNKPNYIRLLLSVIFVLVLGVSYLLLTSNSGENTPALTVLDSPPTESSALVESPEIPPTKEIPLQSPELTSIPVIVITASPLAPTKIISTITSPPLMTPIPVIIAPSDWVEGMIVVFEESAITYARIDDNTAAFTIKPEYPYRVHTIFTNTDQTTWYRLQDDSSSRRGWIKSSDLPIILETRG